MKLLLLGKNTQRERKRFSNTANCLSTQDFTGFRYGGHGLWPCVPVFEKYFLIFKSVKLQKVLTLLFSVAKRKMNGQHKKFKMSITGWQFKNNSRFQMQCRSPLLP